MPSDTALVQRTQHAEASYLHISKIRDDLLLFLNIASTSDPIIKITGSVLIGRLLAKNKLSAFVEGVTPCIGSSIIKTTTDVRSLA